MVRLVLVSIAIITLAFTAPAFAVGGLVVTPSPYLVAEGLTLRPT
jgi:hypothetical protein